MGSEMCIRDRTLGVDSSSRMCLGGVSRRRADSAAATAPHHPAVRLCQAPALQAQLVRPVTWALSPCPSLSLCVRVVVASPCGRLPGPFPASRLSFPSSLCPSPASLYCTWVSEERIASHMLLIYQFIYWSPSDGCKSPRAEGLLASSPVLCFSVRKAASGAPCSLFV